MSEKVTDEVIEKAGQIADILNGTPISDALKILATHYLFIFLQRAQNSDVATVEKEMRDYFDILNESFHEIIRAQR